jgi:hypothetical protein
MARKNITLKASERAKLEECEKIATEFEYEGYDGVIERFNAVEGVEPPVFSEDEGWKVMTFCGVETRSAVSGKPLLDNWAAAARRKLLEVA